MRRKLLELLLADRLAVEPLLQVIEGRDVERRPLSFLQHQQLAVQHRIESEAGRGETADSPRIATPMPTEIR